MDQALSVVIMVLLALCSKVQAQNEGTQYMEMYTSPGFDNFTNTNTYATFMNQHYYMMQVYAPYWNSRSSWYPRGFLYQDSYAIYPYTDIPKTHPEWILHDVHGNLLYITYACSGGTCPQYAADVGNQNYRDYWIQNTKSLLSGGTYAGIWVDDVNFEWRIGDGNGNIQIPIDPRTGQNMTLDAWQGYFVEFLQQIRGNFTNDKILHNAIWSADPDLTGPYVKQQILACDYYCLERGVVDDGLQPFGSGFWGLDHFLSFVDKVHGLNKYVDFHSYAGNEQDAEYQVAFYFIMNVGGDVYGTSWSNWPTKWWFGYDVNLGNALGARYTFQKVVRRDFQNGVVLANPPGSNVTVDMGKPYLTLGNVTASTFTLQERQGLVLRPAS